MAFTHHFHNNIYILIYSPHGLRLGWSLLGLRWIGVLDLLDLDPCGDQILIPKRINK
jgi:hypothetical protein